MQRNRLLMLGIAVVVAAAVVVAVVAFAGGGGSSSSAPATTSTGATQPGGGTEATSTFAGVPQRGDTLGKASAPATMFVFEDPQCPYCRQWNIDTLPTVVQRYVRTGRLKIAYRGIAIISDNSYAGIRAVYAAGLHDKLWNMAEALYERQGQEGSGWITIPVIKDAAKEVGLDPAAVVRDADRPVVTKELQNAAKEASGYGVQGTPTFAIQKTLGAVEQLQVTSLEPDGFTQALDAALS